MNESLANGENNRQAQWTESIGVGSKSFLEGIKDQLGILAKGRSILERTGELQLRERTGTYNAVFDGKKEDIGPENGYYFGVIPDISAR